MPGVAVIVTDRTVRNAVGGVVAGVARCVADELLARTTCRIRLDVDLVLGRSLGSALLILALLALTLLALLALALLGFGLGRRRVVVVVPLVLVLVARALLLGLGGQQDARGRKARGAYPAQELQDALAR